jgi:hypothetical protein
LVLFYSKRRCIFKTGKDGNQVEEQRYGKVNEQRVSIVENWGSKVKDKDYVLYELRRKQTERFPEIIWEGFLKRCHLTIKLLNTQ